MKIEITQTKLLSGHKSSIYALEKIDNDTFLSAGGDGWIVEWAPYDHEDGQLISQVEAQIFSMIYVREHDQIWAGDMNGGIYVISRSDRKMVFKKHQHTGGTYLLQQIGSLVVSGGNDGTLTVWSPEDHYPKESIQLSRQRLRAVALHPSEPLLAIGGAAGEIYILHTESWKWVQTIHSAHDGTIFDLLFSPDGKHLYSGAMDAHLKKWNWQDENLTESIPAHRFTINQLAFLDSKGLIITASRDNSIKVWAHDTLKLLKVVDDSKDHYHLNSVNALMVLDEQDVIVTGSDDRTIRLWQLREEVEN